MKKQNFKKQKKCFCAVTIQVYMPKIRFLGWMVWAVDEGQKIKKSKMADFFTKFKNVDFLKIALNHLKNEEKKL